MNIVKIFKLFYRVALFTFVCILFCSYSVVICFSMDSAQFQRNDSQTTSSLVSPDNSKEKVTSSGSGFLVSSQGHIVTNAHVVSGCASMRVRQDDGRSYPVKVLYKSDKEDLALLVSDIKNGKIAQFRSSPLMKLGENVYAFGFPLPEALSTSGNFTLGNITALAGLQDDTSRVQISAPVQPGNSGGPLLDSGARVVGVVTSKLNVIKVAAITQDIAQNINFAIKGSVVIDFLSGHGVSLSEANGDKQLTPVEIAETAKGFTYCVECLKTYEAVATNDMVKNDSQQLGQRYDQKIKSMISEIVLTTKPELLDGIKSFFSDIVFFYGKNTPRDSVLYQKMKYLERWDVLNYQILDCRISPASNTDEFIVTARIKFFGKRIDKEVRGVTETIWTIKAVSGNLKVTSETSKILERF